MFEAHYGREPFDLRLTVLRLIRKLHIILLATVLGTIVFGGGYYVKHVALVRDYYYQATSTYKVEFVDEPSKSGDYFINEMSWNTYVCSDDFVTAVLGSELLSSVDTTSLKNTDSTEWLSATLASDIHVPTVTVTTDSPDITIAVEMAVREIMCGYFAENNPQIKSISVIDPAYSAEQVKPDVRPFRACILSAVLSCFFAVVIILLYEIGNDGIWLPATIRKRYGIKCVGTLGGREFEANLNFIFRNMKKVAVCTVDEYSDPVRLAETIRERLKDGRDGNDTEWIPVPAPVICPESAECMRNMDGVILCVDAGTRSGKRLERVLEFMAEQDVKVTAILLDNADEWLIKAYYMIPGNTIANEER